MGGEEEFRVDGELYDSSSQRIAKFSVTGNSKRTSSWGIGGMNSRMWSGADDLTRRALTSASEQVVKFMKDNM
jgi:hypothetical protein